MKNLYILLLSILFLQNKAQHTLTAAFNPVIGDVETMTNLDTAGLFLGSSGTSQIWNYTGISTGTYSANSSTYVPMSSVPFNSLYPAGNIARQFAIGGFSMVYNNTNTKIEYLGVAAPSMSNCTIYNDPVTYFTLPFAYGSTSIDSYSRTAESGTVITTGDGTGTLQLPSGNYNNVLKIKLVFYDLSGINTIEDRYYSSISKFPLLTISSTTMGATVYKGGAINAIVATTLNESFKEETFIIFPNPVTNGTLFLNTTHNEPINQVEIINVLGQTVLTFSAQQLNHSDTKKIDVSTLQKGIYYLNIHTAKTSVTKKIIIE